MLETVFAIIKAIPIVKKWIDQAVAFYVSKSIDSMREADTLAIRKAIDEQDQRDLEKQLNSTKAGKPSDLPGTEFRDTLPGVVRIEGRD